MHDLRQLDGAVSEIASSVFQSVPIASWQKAILFAKYTPDGSVSGHDFDYHLVDGTINQRVIPDAQQRAAIYELTDQHLRLTQDLGLPRWYKMIVTVNRDGKFSVDFEYNDNYQEGDIIKRG